MRRFSRETQRNYLRDVGRFATWLGRSPHTATAEDIRQFQFEQHEAGVPAPTMNSIVSALRFLFRSEEHTSELQSLMRISYAVFCLKKKKQIKQTANSMTTLITNCYKIQRHNNQTTLRRSDSTP